MFLLVSLSSVTPININQDRSSCSHSVPLPIRGNFVRFWTFLLIYIVFSIYANIHSSDWCWCCDTRVTHVRAHPPPLGVHFLSLRLNKLHYRKPSFKAAFISLTKEKQFWQSGERQREREQLKPPLWVAASGHPASACLSSWSTNKQATTNK